MATAVDRLKSDLEQDFAFIKVHLSNKEISVHELTFYIKLITVLVCMADNSFNEHPQILEEMPDLSSNDPISMRYREILIKDICQFMLNFREEFPSKFRANFGEEMIERAFVKCPKLVVEEIHTTGSIEFTISMGALFACEYFSGVDAKDLINLASEYLKSLLAVSKERYHRHIYIDDNTLELLREYDEVKVEFLNKDGSGAIYDLKKTRDK